MKKRGRDREGNTKREVEVEAAIIKKTRESEIDKEDRNHGKPILTQSQIRQNKKKYDGI